MIIENLFLQIRKPLRGDIIYRDSFTLMLS